MSDLPKSVHIMDVGPRDGLQIEPRILSPEQKVQLIEALADAGVSEIEVGSFVNPKAVPQMADSDEVLNLLPRRKDVVYRALWLNPRGLERAIANGRAHIDGKLTITASETFVKRNTNRSIDQTLAEIPDWISRYERAGVKADGVGVMAAFGCNFEGYIPDEKVVDLLAKVERQMNENGCELRYISLADTMGWANPAQVKRLVSKVREKWPEATIKLHLHDTRGQAVANAVAGMEVGVAEFDSAIGGLGGCPFAGHKGAAGNICTEDLVFSCQEMGIETGIDLEKLVAAAKLAEELVGHELPGKVMKGGTLGRYRTH